jgi:ribonuclease HI
MTIALPCESEAVAAAFSAQFHPVDAARLTSVVYTDGACSQNGRAGARGGVGVFWGEGDPRNVSRMCTAARPSNNTAELGAVLDAAQTIREELRAHGSAPREYCIVTDSKYTINCVDVWFEGWRAKEWRTAGGAPVQNLEVIRAIHDELQAARALTSVRLVHVRGHLGGAVPGNVAADRLAVEGRRIAAKAPASRTAV